MIFRKKLKNKLSPRCKYIIWVFFVIFLIFPILIFSINNFSNNSGIIRSEENVFKNLNDNVSFFENQDNNEISYIFINSFKEGTVSFIRVIIDFLFIILIVMFIIFIFWNMFINYIAWNNVLKNEKINQILKKCKEKLGIKRNVKIIKQNVINGPSTRGIFSIKIFFSDIVFLLSDRELECIFMHELSHYKRKDTIMNEIIILIKSIYFFNPAIGKLIKHMKLDMETATDELAISKLKDIKDAEFCDVLIKMNNLCDSKSEYMLGLVDKESKLEYRVNAILDKEKTVKYNIFTYIYAIFIIVVMVFILYPISYGRSEIPKLYLQLDNGNIVNIENEDTIKLTENSGISIFSDNDNNIEHIFYEEIKTDTERYYSNYIDLYDEIFYKNGEYICKFTLNGNNEETVSYVINVLVE